MFLKQLQTELPYDPEIPLLNTYLEKTKPLVWKDTCIPTFIAALFTIAKIWKQYKYPSTDKQDKEDVVYTYTHTHTHTHTHTQEYDSPVKNNEVMPFAVTCMNLEIIILSEVSQSKTNIIWHQLYVESKIWHKWTYLWNRNRPTDKRTDLWLPRGDGWGWEGLEFGISRCKWLYIGLINNKILLYSTGNYI